MERLDPMGEAVARISKPLAFSGENLAIFEREATAHKVPDQGDEAVLGVVIVLVRPALGVVSEAIDADLIDMWARGQHGPTDINNRAMAYEVTGQGFLENFTYHLPANRI